MVGCPSQDLSFAKDPRKLGFRASQSRDTAREGHVRTLDNLIRVISIAEWQTSDNQLCLGERGKGEKREKVLPFIYTYYYFGSYFPFLCMPMAAKAWFCSTYMAKLEHNKFVPTKMRLK